MATLAVSAMLVSPVLAHQADRFRPSEIRQAQHDLEKLGYELGRIDGVLGTKTRTAMRKGAARRPVLGATRTRTTKSSGSVSIEVAGAQRARSRSSADDLVVICTPS